MNTDRLQQVLAEGATRSIAVLGDVMLDRFIYGKVSRISPEAPVPVVEVIEETDYPGGAANVARNLRPFCRDIFICGITGRDTHGVDLRRLLSDGAISTDLLIDCPGHSTTVKTRVIARHQQVVRVDRERRIAPSVESRRSLLQLLREKAPQLDGLILEDYGKGLVDQSLVDEIREIFSATDTIVTVDPNPGNPLHWRGFTAVKPNRLEAFAAAGEPAAEPGEHPLEDRALLRVGEKLLSMWEPRMLLVTLGEHGMMLFQPGQDPFHIPTVAREVFDVSGAGDTAIALFTTALCAGATAEEAAEISNLASGVVVGKLGTASLEPEELISAALKAEQHSA
jgi:D-glycero-beta-D-manno-heptose-7-phosphate kinase